MFGRFRRFTAALAAFALLTGFAVPAAATVSMEDVSNSPPAIDALFLRPFGMVALVFGVVLAVPATAITLITHPHQVHRPLNTLVWRPIKYIWGEPIGGH